FKSTLEPKRHEQHAVIQRFSRRRLWGSLALVGSNFLGNSWVKVWMHSPRRAAMHRSPDFIQRLHLSLSLLQPVRHAHLAVHRRGSGEVLAGLLTLSRAPVEFAEAEVAVGDERSHAERRRQRQGKPIALASLPRRQWMRERGPFGCDIEPLGF